MMKKKHLKSSLTAVALLAFAAVLVNYDFATTEANKDIRAMESQGCIDAFNSGTISGTNPETGREVTLNSPDFRCFSPEASYIP